MHLDNPFLRGQTLNQYLNAQDVRAKSNSCERARPPSYIQIGVTVLKIKLRRPQVTKKERR